MSDIVPRLHPNYLILPETARNPGYSATVRFQRPNSSSRPGISERGGRNSFPYTAAKRERWSVGRGSVSRGMTRGRGERGEGQEAAEWLS